MLTTVELIVLSLGILPCLVSSDCAKPTNLNQKVIINPDLASYATWDYFVTSCPNDNTKHGPDTVYCADGGDSPDYWDPNPSSVSCIAQCTTDEFDDDVRVTNSSNNKYPKNVFESGEVAYFSCAIPGSFTGQTLATCEDGEFNYNDPFKPTCTAHCPEPTWREGLNFTTSASAVNVSNDLYYEDGTSMEFFCNPGYPPLNCTSPSDCTRICLDGTWGPDKLPSCVDLTTIVVTTHLVTTDVTTKKETTLPNEQSTTSTTQELKTPTAEITTTLKLTSPSEISTTEKVTSNLLTTMNDEVSTSASSATSRRQTVSDVVSVTESASTSKIQTRENDVTSSATTREILTLISTIGTTAERSTGNKDLGLIIGLSVGFGVALLVILGLLYFRKKKEEETHDQSSHRGAADQTDKPGRTRSMHLGERVYEEDLGQGPRTGHHSDDSIPNGNRYIEHDRQGTEIAQHNGDLNIDEDYKSEPEIKGVTASSENETEI